MSNGSARRALTDTHTETWPSTADARWSWKRYSSYPDLQKKIQFPLICSEKGTLFWESLDKHVTTYHKSGPPGIIFPYFFQVENNFQNQSMDTKQSREHNSHKQQQFHLLNDNKIICVLRNSNNLQLSYSKLSILYRITRLES